MTTPILRVICQVYDDIRHSLFELKKIDHSTVSLSRHLVGAHQNLNSSRDLTTTGKRAVRRTDGHTTTAYTALT